MREREPRKRNAGEHNTRWVNGAFGTDLHSGEDKGNLPNIILVGVLFFKLCIYIDYLRTHLLVISFCLILSVRRRLTVTNIL